MRVTIIDDDPLITEIVRAVLAREGCVVHAADNGDDGFALVTAGDYDAIIVDVVLPDTMGFDLVARIRGAGVRAPILMLTSRSDTADIVRGLEAGADDYLAKPFQPPVLLARLRALHRRTAIAPAGDVRFGALRLDAATHRIFCNGLRLRLTPRELALLEMLIRSPDTPISRADILRHVWDIDFDPGTNVLDVHVARLRAKLRDANADAVIVAVRGTGFRLALDDAERGDAAG